ncbi:MAG: two-component system sensor histidine kinase NtrB [Panacagrimonas sp.]
MTIRRILLLAFLLVSLVPATVLTLLAFDRSHAAMQTEIEQAVLRSAASVSSDVDKLLFERMLNATTWNHLEVMQDLRLDDVDKRLSGFLAEMKHRYGGVYLDLHALDPRGRVVASSNPARIGESRSASADWRAADLPGGRVRIERPGVERDARYLSLRSPIASQFTEGALGELVLDVDWNQLERLLDAGSNPSRQVLLLDVQDAVIAASAGLRAQGFDFGAALPGWSAGADVELRRGAPVMSGDIVLGRRQAGSTTPLRPSGWTTLLVQSREVALAPVHQMGWTFAGLLAATTLVTVAMTFWVAGVIARPVVALTEFTRGFLQPGEPARPPPDGPGEIGELNRSFVRLVEDLQRSQQTLVQASRLAALGEITALMAHEVRTPLGILRSSAQMLRAEAGLSAEGTELLRIVESETERLNRLVGSMLDSARTRPPQRRPTDVHALITHTVALLAAQARDRGVAVHLNLEPTVLFADCDAEQITQVLLNLMMNALQILPRGGRVELRARSEHGRLLMEVADDGQGIPPEERSRMFEPFVFKREGGVGLGLAVVRQIVRSHGGEVVADRSEWGGALFRVWLPQHNPESP